MENTHMAQLDNSFITYAGNILGETSTGLSGMKIIEYCNSFAVDYNRSIPYSYYPNDAPNKRTTLIENLKRFSDEEQFCILQYLCELPEFIDNEGVRKLKSLLYQRYGHLSKTRINDTELVQSTRHWLSKHTASLEQYQNALSKFETGSFTRNVLDDMRLSFELLCKDLLANDKSLENQISEIGKRLKEKGVASEFRNLITQTITYYTKYQNNHVKHDDSINEYEVEYIIENTSIIMKLLIRIL